MGQPKAAVGDSVAGVCVHPAVPPGSFPASGVIVKGSSSVFVDGKPAAAVGDTVVTSCPICGAGVIVSGDSMVLVEGKPIAVVGSSVVLGSGMTAAIVKGSSDVL